MNVQLYYDPATFCNATATARQWRVRCTIVANGTSYNVNQLFPDYLQTALTDGYVTADELKELLGQLVIMVARRRLGIDPMPGA